MNPTPDTTAAILYCRVSTEEQGREGASLPAQEATLREVAKRKGLDPIVITDVASGKSLKRPGITRALDMLAKGEAGYLLALRTDRLSRDVHDLSGLAKRAERERWAIILSDMDIDTSTPMGDFTLGMSVQVAQLERKMIGQRTREGMAQRKAETGKHMGRRRETDSAIVRRIREARDAGLSYAKIAAALTDEEVPTTRGGTKWYASTVRSIDKSLEPID
ncbi:recombinase family protein [Brevibacterium litoralis]|uniref:recombinase family protein n=1 Tax=Brevibacterium litoralis TaxID=3138935 RepID=UPI0032F01044